MPVQVTPTTAVTAALDAPPHRSPLASKSLF